MYITVNDGTKIHITDIGQGLPLLLIAGGGFSSQIFKHQIDYFAQDFRVIAIDMRAHGKSDRIIYGMRISRLAKDLKEVTDSLQLNHFHMIGHSLGCSVIYSFLDMFLPSQIDKVILIDEPPVLTTNPAWSKEEKLNFGATYEAAKNYDFINKMTTGNFSLIKKEIVAAMTTKEVPAHTREFIESCFDIHPEPAALLYNNNLCQDWRDVIQRIRIPTLIIGGKASITPWQSQQWINHQIPQSQLRIFEEQENGSHFMFVENPTLFNDVVSEFINSKQ